jgi:uncharacterized protein (TIGR02646 family)
MIRLDRSIVKVLAKWQEYVEKAFPDCDAFKKKAAAFEALSVDDPIRRTGFKTYAPDVLPKSKKGCDFKAIWGKSKKALAEMSHQKCAYCESPINAERSAAVEHYKPKSLFPLLAYDWDNYFLGCGGCNGAKSDKWPAGGRAYVRPDEGDPSALFVFWEDGSMAAVQPGGNADLTIIDLNMNASWLCDHRAASIALGLDDIKELLSRPEAPVDLCLSMARNTYLRLQNPKLPHAAALRQCFLRVWEQRFPGISL